MRGPRASSTMGSEQPGRQRLAVLRGPRVLGAEGLEDVEELLAGMLVVADPLEERVEQAGGVLDIDRPPGRARAARFRVCADSGTRANKESASSASPRSISRLARAATAPGWSCWSSRA